MIRNNHEMVSQFPNLIPRKIIDWFVCLVEETYYREICALVSNFFVSSASQISPIPHISFLDCIWTDRKEIELVEYIL